ncbi:MAG: dienelactone hydrolase family protein [Ardenticatenaceae bacterium]|nr:dienelactone hydrolase family protein [Ardenticatenaceae bacterium]
MQAGKPILVEDVTAVLPHRVLQPNTPGPHPTVVMIHGHQGSEDVMWIFRQSLPAGWLVVAPRAIVADGDGRFSWHPRQQDEWPSLAAFETAVSKLDKFLDTLPARYDADPDQLYLMGFSQGAAAAIALALHQPEKAKGIASLVGFVPTGVDEAIHSQRLAEIPVFMAVGKQDERVPLAIAREGGKAVRAAGATLTYVEYETGHKLNGAGMRQLKQWWDERASKP